MTNIVAPWGTVLQFAALWMRIIDKVVSIVASTPGHDEIPEDVAPLSLGLATLVRMSCGEAVLQDILRRHQASPHKYVPIGLRTLISLHRWLEHLVQIFGEVPP
jgi:hypothetical protein